MKLTLIQRDHLPSKWALWTYIFQIAIVILQHVGKEEAPWKHGGMVDLEKPRGLRVFSFALENCYGSKLEATRGMLLSNKLRPGLPYGKDVWGCRARSISSSNT